MFLLTDGSILCQRDYPNGNQWAKLVPDINGSYVNGNWVAVASSHWTRLYYASGVFADGRVIVSGGEYSNGGSETTKTEIYDPVANTWTEIPAPSGWTMVGDAPSAILADGRFFMGSIPDNRCAFYDPTTSAWTAGPNKIDTQSTEESWSLLWDNSVLAVMCRLLPGTERWVPSLNQWISAGNTASNLVLPGSLEVGAALTLTDGRCFVIGGTGHTGLYTMPGVPNGTGTWAAGPDFPQVNSRTVGAEDAPACLMPNGKIICTVGPVTAQGGTYEAPTYFFIFDGTTLQQITAPPNSLDVPYNGRFMLTPTGQVLFAAQGQIQVYTPSGGPDPSWKPVITTSPASVNTGSSYTVQGRLFNGLSQAVAYGDEAGIATNYPIVRIQNNSTGHVFYCRTYNHSTMAINTGNQTVLTNFQVPAGAEAGASTLTVVANGIPSDPVAVTVHAVSSVRPTGFSFLRGLLVSGGVAEMGTSDNSYLIAKPGMVLNTFEYPIQLTIQATSPLLTPTNFSFTLESSGTDSALWQRIALFNYQTNAWEELDSRALTLTDNTVTITPSGDVTRFINQSTGAMNAKVSAYTTGPVASWPWNLKVDFVQWQVGN